MKKTSRKYLALSLAAALTLGNFSFAAGSNPFSEAARNLNLDEKIVGFEDFNLNSEQDVRVIVEFYNQPVIEAATAKGLQVEEMNAAEVSTQVKAIEKEQASLLSTIERIADPQIHENFTNVFNGVSMTVQANEVEEIAKLDGVKSVYIANEYARPEPEMRDSHQLTQSRWVNEELNYKGEGLVVAIIDTGLDAYHQDFNIDEEALASVKFTPEGVNAVIAKKKLKGQYVNVKVPYGYNYMDNNHIIQDIAPGASMHGMHVGGTVAANGVIKGVAPNAQLLALKVFGNDPSYPSTYSDIIIAAVDDAITLGADVMNLSLGSTAAFVDRNDPEQKSITRAVENGIVMSISAGNSAHFGNGNTATGSKPFATNPDIGVSGSPGLTAESMQVASVDNVTMYENSYEVKVAGKSYIGFSNAPFEAKTYEMVALKGSKIGLPGDFEGVDVAGKVVLVSRGNAFVDTALEAQKGGAVGVVIYNVAGREIVTKPVDTAIPLMMIPAEGSALEGVIAANGGVVNADIAFKDGLFNPNSGMSSSFSSWGTTPDLGFKPDIAAPGGNIYSTLENNQYGTMSGTSMAAPHAAGGAALLLQRLNTTSDFASLYTTAAEKAKLAKAILMNTGRPVTDKTYGNDIDAEGNFYDLSMYTSPRRQGAGSMDLKSATLTDVVVYDKSKGREFQASHNAGEVKDAFSFTMTAYNQGTETAYYALDAVVQTNLPGKDATGRALNMLESMYLDNVSYTFTVGGETVTSVAVPAGGSVDITVNFDIKDAVFAHNPKLTFASAYPNGNFVEGFIFLYPQGDAENSTILALKTAYMDAVDALKANAGRIAELNVAINAAKEVLATLETTQATADAEVLAVETIIAAKAAYEAAEAARDAAETALNDLVAAHGELEALTTTIALYDALEAANTSFAAAETALATAEAAVTTLAGELAALETDLAGQVTEKTRLEGLIAIETNETLKAAFEAELALVIAKIATLEADIAAKMEAITAAEVVVNEAITALTTAQDAVIAAKAALTDAGLDLDADVAALKVAKEALAAATTALEEKQAALDALVMPSEEDLAKIETLEALKTAAAEAKAAVEAQKVIIADKEFLLEGAKEGVAGFVANANAAYKAYIDGTVAFRNFMPLSFPYIAFNGEWAKADAFDGLRGTAASFYNMTSLLFNNDAEDAGYFMGKVSAFSPNGDGYKDEIASLVSFTRNLKNVTFTIENEAGKKITTIGFAGDQRKDYFDGRQGGNYTYFPSQVWNGRVNLKTAKDGNYFYVISGKLDDAAKTVKTIKFPVMLDTTAPTAVKLETGKNLKVVFEDNLSGISSYALFKMVEGEEVLVKGGVVNGEFDLKALGLQGSDQVVFVAFDNAGNVGATQPMTLDTVMPEISGPSFLEDGANPEPYSFDLDGKITFKGTAQDFSPYTLKIADQVVVQQTDYLAAPKAFEHTYVTDRDGKHEIVINATDIFGNVNEFKRHLFVDTKAPTVEILEVKAGGKKLTVEDGVFETPAGTSKITVKVKAADNFPDLTINVNESFAFGVYKDYYSTRTELKPVTKTLTYTFEVDPTETVHPLLVEVIDAAGWKSAIGFTGYVGTVGPNKFPGAVVVSQVPRITDGANFENNGADPSTGGSTGGTTGGNPDPVTPPVGGNPVTPPAGGGTSVPITSTPVTPAVDQTPVTEVEIDETETAKGDLVFTKAYIDGYKVAVGNNEQELRFNPDGQVTRAEFAKMLALVLGLDVTDTAVAFEDAQNAWYSGYVNAINKAGIMNGYSATSFKPEKLISRAEIAITLANAYAFRGIELEAGETGLQDIAGHKSADVIAKLVTKGVISGYNNQFRPDASATRAEAVKMMNVFIGRTVTEGAVAKFADTKGHWAEAHIAAASEDAAVAAK